MGSGESKADLALLSRALAGLAPSSNVLIWVSEKCSAPMSWHSPAVVSRDGLTIQIFGSTFRRVLPIEEDRWLHFAV